MVFPRGGVMTMMRAVHSLTMLTSILDGSADRCWKYGHFCPSSCTKPQATAAGGLRRYTAEAYESGAVLFLPQVLRLGTRRNSIQLQRYYAPILPEQGKSGNGRDVLKGQHCPQFQKSATTPILSPLSYEITNNVS
jgi:hypothetical protein